MTISKFDGEYRWLSNFYPCDIVINGKKYPSTEHYYQAMKFEDPTYKEKIRLAPSAAEAKKLGKGANKRKDWNYVKLGVMRNALVKKFEIPEFRDKLLATGNQELIEGNHWHDVFWGQCNCDDHKSIGENHLGKLLMDIRSELQTLMDLGILP